MIDYNRPVPITEFLSGKIPVTHPSDEPLVCMNDRFICDSKYYRWAETGGKALPGSGPYIMCRRTVFEMLENAEALLPEGYRFIIFDAYRPVAVQQALWDYYRGRFREQNPEKTEEEIDEMTLFCVSLPSYDILLPSLHNTGGAVDLSIIGPDGKELDMGCEFDEFTDAAWTAYFEDGQTGDGANIRARDNRRMLFSVMTGAGFTNLPSEWWHFDYGDEKWGLYTNNDPVYAGIPDADAAEMIPQGSFITKTE